MHCSLSVCFSSPLSLQGHAAPLLQNVLQSAPSAETLHTALQPMYKTFLKLILVRTACIKQDQYLRLK